MTDHRRRRILQGASGLVAATALPFRQAPPASSKAATDVTGRLARYMVEARDRTSSAASRRGKASTGFWTRWRRWYPARVSSRARWRSATSASRAESPEASVLTTNIRTSAVNAALANGMFGHADETDDFEPVTKAHPGCAVVPAALAMAEREGRSGLELLQAVTLGYDLCCRFLLALGPDLVRATHRSAEGTSATFGSAAAAASLARLDEKGDALRALVRGAAGLRRLELGSRHRARRKGLRLRRHGRPQRRHGRPHGPDRIYRRRRCARWRAQHARGAVDGAKAGRNAGRSRQPVLRHRNGHQDIFRRLSDSGSARRVPHAAPRRTA